MKTDGTCEARTAARWWANQLHPTSKAQTGDAMNEMFALAAKSKQESPTAEQVDAFRAHLEQSIVPFLRSHAWADALDDPQRGSALRVIGVDYGPGPVNPGQVKVGVGYNAAPIELELIEE